jgi:hypothetical protein
MHLAVTLLVIFIFVYFVGNAKRDSTDSPSKRSGLWLFTDHATGVQYVGAPLLGFTVRMDKGGKPYSDAK